MILTLGHSPTPLPPVLQSDLTTVPWSLLSKRKVTVGPQDRLQPSRYGQFITDPLPVELSGLACGMSSSAFHSVDWEVGPPGFRVRGLWGLGCSSESTLLLTLSGSPFCSFFTLCRQSSQTLGGRSAPLLLWPQVGSY